jgi:dolichol kinase
MREIKRHIFHIVFGTVLALSFYYNILDRTHFAILTVLTAIVFVVYKYYKLPVLHQIMTALERQHNMHKYPGIGAFYYMLGSTIAVWLYSPNVATASIFIVAWGDGIAGLMRAYSTKRVKTWSSTIFAALVSIIAAQLFVPLIPAIIASAITMITERFDIKLDDNLYIPILAGAILQFLG